MWDKCETWCEIKRGGEEGEGDQAFHGSGEILSGLADLWHSYLA